MTGWIWGAYLLLAASAGPKPAIPEGVFVEQTRNSRGDQTSLKLWFTAERARSEVTVGEETHVIIADWTAGRVLMLTPDEPTYLDLPLEAHAKILGLRSKAPAAGPNDPMKPPTCAGTEKVGAWTSQKCKVMTPGGRLDLWIAGAIPVKFGDVCAQYQRLGGDSLCTLLSPLLPDLAGFPVQVRGFVSGRLQKIARGPIDPALFRVPRGYKPLENQVLNQPSKPQGEAQ